MLSYAAQLIDYAACLQEQANAPIIMNTSLDEWRRENDRAEEKMAAEDRAARNKGPHPYVEPTEEFSDDIPF